MPKKPVKKIMISKKTGMPIVEEEKPEVEEDVELTPVCNSGEKRNKKETAEEKRRGLAAILRQSTGKEGWEFPDAAVDTVCVCKLTAEALSCKEHL